MASDALLSDTLFELLLDYVSEMNGAVECGLYTADISPSPATDSAVMLASQPVGTWYSRQALTYFSPLLTSDGRFRVEAQSHEFTYSGSSAPETIHGYFVAGSSNGAVLHAGRLGSPISMDGLTKSVIVAPAITFSQVAAE